MYFSSFDFFFFFCLWFFFFGGGDLVDDTWKIRYLDEIPIELISPCVSMFPLLLFLTEYEYSSVKGNYRLTPDSIHCPRDTCSG